MAGNKRAGTQMEKLFEQQATMAFFLLFFVPGFLMIQVYDLLVPSPRRDFSKSLFEAVAYSAVNFGVFSPLIYLMRSGFFAPFWYWVCVTMILVVAPVVWSVLFLCARKSKWFRKYFLHPILCPWDYVFAKRPSALARSYHPLLSKTDPGILI